MSKKSREKEKEKVKSLSVTRKEFKYEKGTVSVSFVLRVDVIDELADCVEILNLATKEMLDELQKLN